ncbi:hypothetical protein [Sphingomonas sp. Leaf198]|uniref:hypothetical protein n=1 Tax=Sphingomonas sp. Leaf198 TaxID=1736299 RepID=UPI0006F35CE7|nr:hypothetical protein [Sphingomonas sp. Leaf198]KQS50980.1 hypothetical protein ASG20_02505 [Sphingomonas sp. Leaf198]
MILTKSQNLYKGEEAIREESLRRLAAVPDMAAHLEIIEQSLNLIYVLLPSRNVHDADQRTIGNLGIRMFNALNASLKLSLSGYYQASGLQLRDLLETTFLLDYFSTDPTLVTQWRTIPEKQRKAKFGPAKIRTELDRRDGFIKARRRDAYDMLCSLAGHATPEGVVMLVPVPGGTDVHCGPFLENTALHSVLSETAKHAVTAAGAFRTVVQDETLDQNEARIVFMEAEADWFERFFETPDRTGIAKLRETLASARAGKP